MIKNIILDVGKVLVAWEPEDAMKQLGFDDKTVKAVADATVNTPVWPETDRGVWSDEQILQAFYEKAPEYKKEIDLFWNHLELAIKQFSYTKEWISNMKKEGLHVYILSNYGDTWTYDGDTSLDMDEEAIDSMLSTLSSLTAIEEISDYTDLKEFGFDQPEDLISYTTSEGSVSLFVGNKNDTLNAYYIISADGGSTIIRPSPYRIPAAASTVMALSV